MLNKCCSLAYAHHYAGCVGDKKRRHVHRCLLRRQSATGSTCAHFDPPKYGLEAGRMITIDGKGALVLAHVLNNNVSAMSPVDADILARRIVNALNHMEVLRLSMKKGGTV